MVLGSRSTTDRAGELAAESRFQTLCRVGFFGRGLLFILIGVLAFGTGRTEDLDGALEYLGDGQGRIMLVAIAAGMLVYALWRLSDAAFGIENPGSDGKAMRKRAAVGLIGIIYLYLAWKAVRVLLAGSGGGMDAQQQAETVLDLPGGGVVLALAALLLLVAGLYQLRKAAQCSFLRRLDHRAQQPLVKWLGRAGYAARAIVFLTVAYLIGKAALDGRSNEAGGMEEALDFFSGPVLYAVALGLMLFGTFSIIEALFRRIHDAPSPEAVKAKVDDALGG